MTTNLEKLKAEIISAHNSTEYRGMTQGEEYTVEYTLTYLASLNRISPEPDEAGDDRAECIYGLKQLMEVHKKDALCMTYLKRIEAALAKPAVREGWQPIETAPMDGSDILAITSVFHHDELKWSRPEKIYYEHFENRGWLCSRTHKQVAFQPEKWQSLPPLPPTPPAEKATP